MRYSRILKRSTFVVLYLLCVPILLESSLRVLGYFYSNRNEYKDFRNKNDLSIVCLGDSFTFGIGVDPADNFPGQLESLLNSNRRDAHFKIFNMAVPGSNSSQHLQYMEHILEKYDKPYMFIVLTGVNDSWNLADSNIDKFIDPEQGKEDLAKIKKRKFFSRFRIYKMLRVIMLNLKGRPAESTIDPFKLIAAYENINLRLLRELVKDNLRKMVELTRAHDVKIILQSYPRGDPYGGDLAKEVALETGVPFSDNCAIFEKELQRSDFKDLFLFDISHPNEKGYRLMADSLYDTIEKMTKEDERFSGQ